MNESRQHPFVNFIDLAAERLGGMAILASDEFFAEKENLLKPGRGISLPDRYTDRGKWMDGWESRRKRTPGNDWCIIKLGQPGIIRCADIDTHHFLGKHPPYASLDAACIDDGERDRLLPDDIPWQSLLPKSALNPDSQNIFPVTSTARWTHVRLNIFPDGGVARLRIFGEVAPDWSRYNAADLIDFAAIPNGGLPIRTSDMFFGNVQNMLLPGRATTIGDGWETQRRRGPGFDWTVIRLGRSTDIRKIELSTHHFKGNFPDACSVDACTAPYDAKAELLLSPATRWREIVPKSKLLPDARHFFENELTDAANCSHIRLNIYPDGGVSRLRVWGTLHIPPDSVTITDTRDT
jgi:allantoicase